MVGYADCVGHELAERDKQGDDATFAAVLLTSVNFLNSDFIANEELPFILAAAKARKMEIFWIRLTPCLIRATPLRHLQAAAGMEKPLNKMAEYDWMEALQSLRRVGRHREPTSKDRDDRPRGSCLFQCARAIIRSKFWETAGERRNLPSPGEILAHLSQQRVGEEYDKNWPERARSTLW
ncbi:MAG: hypothetical protein JO066_08845 [Verrucomicrobia bacterium]|nr:hypothetical protein [Verrucomicrobiota bacterium]